MLSSTDNIIKLAWSDKVSFEEIKKINGLSESAVIKIMRKNLKPKSFKIWRERVTGRTSISVDYTTSYGCCTERSR